MIMNIPSLRIIPFSYRYSHTFTKLRNEIENETDNLLAKRNERKETFVHVIVKLAISQRRTVTFLAFDKNTAIGYVSIVFPRFKKLRGNAYLTIAIKEVYRNKGIGSKLMDTAESFAKEKGARRMELDVLGKNKRAIELYKRRNYEIEGVKKGAIEEADGFDDIIIMAKKLK